MRDSDDARPTRRGVLAGRRLGLAITGMSAALCLAATACSGSVAVSAKPVHSTGPTVPATPTTQVAISPSNGSTNVKPGASIAVAVSHGKVSSVDVRSSKGSKVTGSLNAAGTVWHSTWPLHTSSRYTVTATARSASGTIVTRTSSFRTLTPSRTYQVQIFEGYHQTYGVGMPIILTFSQPVTHKAAVERAMEIKTSKPVVGAWYWDGNSQLDFRPRNYWPAHTKVDFVGHFNGLEAAPGVYGTANLTQSFSIGTSLIVVASTQTHYLKIYRAGKLYGTWPISTGDSANPTANGTYLTIEKHNPVRMKGPGYNVLVPYSVRFTWSGNYIHDAYWSVAQQGHTNVSHGCVNVSPQHSKIYYNMAIPGDPVTVTGSPAAGKWDDGWTEWFLSWKQLLKGSALHKAVVAGPDGSTFVSPSAAPGSVSTSILHGAKPSNYLSG